MISLFKNLVVRVLRVPPEPHDPMGDVQMLRVFRASPRYFAYKRLGWLIGQAIAVFGALFGIAFMAFIVNPRIPSSTVRTLITIAEFAGLVFVAFQCAFSYALMVLDYEMRWYKVTDRSLRIREGIWFVREMTMTFANIQNISITQGPIERIFGISDLKVETAGGGGSVGKEGHEQPGVFNMHLGFFRGVDNAEEIRDLMRDRLRRARGAGLGDQEDHVPAAPAAPAVAGPDVLAALRELRDEAAAFRLTAETAAGRAAL